jgi:hypothetical protein
LATGLQTPEKTQRLQRKLYNQARWRRLSLYLLYDKIWRAAILRDALACANKGALGTNGVTFRLHRSPTADMARREATVRAFPA